MDGKRKQQQIGVICAIISAIMWGFLPIYWKSLESINSIVIMFYRLVLAFVFMLIICLITYGVKEVIAPLKNKKVILTFFIAGLLISVNWGIFIIAVNSGNIVQASLGYYIEPLFVAIMGVLVFREKVNKYKVTAVLLAFVGVCIMIVSYGQPPTIALLLALSFATYTGIKKKLQAPALLALFYETGLMLPIIVPCLIYMEVTGKGALGTTDGSHLILLALAGVFTAVPLIFFGFAANRIKVISLGLIEYISPSLSLFIGIFVYKEPFDLIQLTGFIIIWIGLAIFTVGEIKNT